MAAAIVPIMITMMASQNHQRMMDDEDDRRRRRVRQEEDDRRARRQREERQRVEQRVEEIVRTPTLAERAETAQEAKRLARSMAAEAKRQSMGRAYPRRCSNSGCREQLNSDGDAASHGQRCRFRPVVHS